MNRTGRHSATILIIEDDPEVRKVMALLLRARGFDTVTAESATQGICLYREYQARIPAVIVDLTLPVMNGVEVMRSLREINPDVGLVAVSGVTRAAELVVDDPRRLVFLSKPMTGDELCQAVTSVLE